MAQKSEKLNSQELRQPDTFQAAGLEAQSWLAEHQKAVVGVVGVLLLGGFAFTVADYMGDRAAERAAKELGAALTVLDRPVAATPEAAMAQDPSKPPFQSQKEQDEALVKSLTEFREANKGTPSAATAALPLAKAQFRLGNHDAALSAFQDFLKAAPKNDPLRVSALEGQGYAFEAQGKLAEAARSFQEMAQADGGGYLAGMGQYHQARILVAEGKKDEAAKLFVEVQEKYPNTAAARQSTERLNVLAAEGVKIPEPAPAAETPAQETK